MLNNETKKIIDNARNILVGKLPAPNTQVEQITLAMLYKFMFDLDQESVELGGQKKYFSKELEKFSWDLLMSKTISAQERMNLYVEALEKFYYQLNLPQTYRDIFKNANVPYRDPEVLSLFLKEIDNLKYGNSENMGDTYEYLLSILGSQGNLGQFRTPRHIIDFIVNIIDPQINEKILDPACGTAGFLISSYKHIINDIKNTDLKFEHKVKILDYINGYDIEPSMVKIAEMNMYLHGCSDPKIFEYDTLTSEDKWDENFDIILANPPFMTPIGGIKPHKKFQVQANRAEVLFIDYILEHLKFNGRAAIIVPDSILYNESSSAYIELRKILVTNNLICIISLPSGIFKPYAKDIKTSILIIDRIKAKKTNEILHLSIKNDGFSLSDTRKPISKNDLPLCNKIVKSFILNSNSKFQIDTSDNNLNAFIFDKNKLAEKKYVLLTSKYLPEDLINSNYETKYLSELISEIKDKVGNKINIKPLSVSNKLGFTNSDELFNDTIYSSNLSNYKIVSKNNFAYNPSRINVGSIALLKDNIVGCVSPMYVVFKIKNENILNPDFLLLLLKDDYFKLIIEKTVYGAVRIQLKFNSLKNLKIPVPPIEKQLEILNKINLHKENISKFEILAKEIEKDINLLVKNTWIK